MNGRLGLLLIATTLLPQAAFAEREAAVEYCDIPKSEWKYESLKPGEPELFQRFVKVFACAFEHGGENYYARIDFPLPYLGHSTEGAVKGTLSEQDLRKMRHFRGESAPDIDVVDDRASFSRNCLDCGEGYTWYFRLTSGRWRLYKVDIKSY